MPSAVVAFATNLPLGRSLPVFVSAVLSDDRLQVLPVQLSPEIAAHFGGRVPHITVSYAAGARAKEAGDLLAEVCSGSDRPVTMEVWQEPLELCARVGAKLSSRELVFSHVRLSEALKEEGVTAAATSHAAAAANDVVVESRILSKSTEAQPTAGTAAQDLPEEDVEEEAELKAMLELDDLLNALDYTPDRRCKSWRPGGEQDARLSELVSSAAPASALPTLLQAALTAASPGQADSSMHAWPGCALSSPGQDAAAALTPAAVAQTMADRALARSLADAERRTSQVHRSARDVFSQAAANAHQQGQRELARELVNKCREHDKLAVEARFRANEAAFDGSNRNLLNRWKVDLHGLHVDEALKVLETHLIALGGLGHPGGILLQVIVGLGRHSVGGVARILPAVVRYLTDAGYSFREEPDNAGVICVLLPGKRNALSGQLKLTCSILY
ncbi:hypothetical protein COCSUDRAFT_40707 [Coccomyxa subellipsoidea C-169]|uniref:Smr domain-containing protein n=1 Tax=Coccomyxa subellipsoidea (strain C-169) TaxID=574566 RepID=I0Z4A2_COCSC|nr:hypothetical protein COCSUDRAFT_40707 [Coccomyxa subellipsoidea C-169]EIE25471.1 hypothetical protein COCSUDRAFT_40707 [Coccomyxa subellipsoidea C-169]|eukprot:XP_005650015.1 hypothetical protein COCSUDRAFT_40707 [Coccomyxa subellipsoidea C-169]